MIYDSGKTGLFILILLVSFAAGSVCAGTIEISAITFIDFDGDGFDDLESDDNDNGIPDRIEADDESAPTETSSLLGDTFNSATQAPTSEYLSHHEAFGAREFSIRGLQTHRIGFTAGEGFGPGNGIGIGNVTSGCEGGVCH